MLKKTIKYTDFDGNERTEDFYFNITKAEALEIEMATDGGLTKQLETIVLEKDAAKVLSIFKNIILKAYGEKSPDGKKFIKTQELRNQFAATEAYSELFMELMDHDKATAFINGVIPKPTRILEYPVTDNK